jgi:hypothetical protein
MRIDLRCFAEGRLAVEPQQAFPFQAGQRQPLQALPSHFSRLRAENFFSRKLLIQ